MSVSNRKIKMSGDEEDYMSDAFLAKCAGHEDIRPGLIKNKSELRSHTFMKRKIANENPENKPKSAKIVEAERREEGLKESISSTNKGYAMLAKMGYKAGQGIGKQSDGRAEPISISIKSDRSGLGRDSIRKEIAKIRQLRRAAAPTLDQVSIEDFRKRLVSKNQEKYNNIDLNKSQNICQKLDMEHEITEPDERWFWPERHNNEEEEEEDEIENGEEFELSEKLDFLTSYLRGEYCYCIWCAVKYNDSEDLTENCPGNQRCDH